MYVKEQWVQLASMSSKEYLIDHYFGILGPFRGVLWHLRNLADILLAAASVVTSPNNPQGIIHRGDMYVEKQWVQLASRSSEEYLIDHCFEILGPFKGRLTLWGSGCPLFHQVQLIKIALACRFPPREDRPTCSCAVFDKKNCKKVWVEALSFMIWSAPRISYKEFPRPVPVPVPLPSMDSAVVGHFFKEFPRPYNMLLWVRTVSSGCWQPYRPWTVL